jgi:ethanolamine utilization protein EutA (predicted chaperonin)
MEHTATIVTNIHLEALALAEEAYNALRNVKVWLTMSYDRELEVCLVKRAKGLIQLALDKEMEALAVAVVGSGTYSVVQESINNHKKTIADLNKILEKKCEHVFVL